MRSARLSVLAILLCLLSSFLFAETITSTGYGVTQNEAEQNAMRNLANQIAVNVSSIAYTASYDDGVTASDSFSDMSIQTSSFTLKGVKIRSTGESNGLYSVIAEIPESASVIYEKELENLQGAISRVNSSLDNLSDDDKLDSYLMLISLLRNYGIAENVLMLLDPESIIDISLPITKAEAEFEYRLLLSKSISEVGMKVENLTALLELEMISAEDSELEAAISEQQTLLEKRRQLQAEMDEEYTMRLEERQQKISTVFESDILLPSFAEEGNAVLDPLFRIEAARNTFSELKNTLDLSVAEIEQQYSNEAEAIVEAVISLEFFSTQLDGNGRPKESVVNSIEDMTQTQLDDLLHSYGKTATEMYLTTYEKLLDVRRFAEEESFRIKGKNFAISNRGTALTTSILPENFDAESLVWNGTAYISTGTETVEVPFSIPYSAWIGERIAYSDISEMMRLYSDVEFWTDIFAEYPGAFTLTIDGCFSDMALTDDSYELMFTRYSIIRNDTGKTVFTDNLNQLSEIHSSCSGSLDDFTIEHDFLLRNYDEV